LRRFAQARRAALMDRMGETGRRRKNRGGTVTEESLGDEAEDRELGIGGENDSKLKIKRRGFEIHVQYETQIVCIIRCISVFRG
jgi:hypothetical protein